MGVGRILVAGQGGSGRAVLVRYRPSGRLDRTFSKDGIAWAPVKGNGLFVAVTVLPDGGIMATGGVDERYLLARFGRRGRPVRRFGKAGVVVRSHDVEVTDAEPGAHGSVVVTSYCFSDRSYFCIARFLRDGSFDDTFGGTGKVAVPVGEISASGYDAVLDDAGAVTAVGDADGDRLVVVRYTSAGTLDTTFAGDGIATGDEVANAGSGRAVAFDGSGGLLVSGFTGSTHYLTRLLA